jgi:HK97 family phage portal protein
MGMISRLLARTRPQPEHRAFYGAAGYTLGNGAVSTANLATLAVENLSAVTGAVELIASSIASLPASIVQDTPDGREPLPGAAAARLLSRPNPRQSWPSFISTLVASTLLQGNGLAMIGTDGRGGVATLTNVPWAWLLPQVIGTGRLAFDLVNSTPEAMLLGIPARLLDSDVLHIKARSDNGILGRSVLSRAPSVLSAAIGAQGFASAVWDNAATPSVAVTLPANVSPEGMRRFESWFQGRYTGASAARLPLILDTTSTVTPLSLSPEDAEALASRRFSVAEIARLFCIPLPLLDTGAGAPPASLTPYLAAYATLALLPIVTAIEAEFDDVLPPGQHLALDLSGLQRGDYTAVASVQAVLKQSGVVTANDARRAVGLPAHPDGDALAGAAPPSWPADAAGVPSLAPKPGPSQPGDLPNVGTHQDGGAP